MEFLLRYQKLIILLNLLLCVFIPYLQYKNINAGFITSYGADFLCPILLYYFIRNEKDIFSKIARKRFSPIQVSFGLFTLCVIWELRQFYYPNYGTFDLIDVTIYFAAVFVCYVIDKKIEKFKKRKI